MLPLILRLKKESHKSIAKAQDIIVDELYKIFHDAVLHGGTAIWRCYHGNRFSEDVDAYLPRDVNKINLLFSHLANRGFKIEKKKVGAHSLYSKIKFGRIIVRLEALFKKVKGSLQEYESIDGNFMMVYTLLPEEFIKEKIEAYKNRHKIRDLYDIFYMLKFVENRDLVREQLLSLIGTFTFPHDEQELRTLILEGLIPKPESMIDYIKRSISYGKKEIS